MAKAQEPKDFREILIEKNSLLEEKQDAFRPGDDPEARDKIERSVSLREAASELLDDESLTQAAVQNVIDEFSNELASLPSAAELIERNDGSLKETVDEVVEILMEQAQDLYDGAKSAVAYAAEAP